MAHGDDTVKPYRPKDVFVAAGMLPYYDILEDELANWGVSITLETYEEAVLTCRDHDTDPDGYNFRVSGHELCSGCVSIRQKPLAGCMSQYGHDEWCACRLREICIFEGESACNRHTMHENVIGAVDRCHSVMHVPRE